MPSWGWEIESIVTPLHSQRGSSLNFSNPQKYFSIRLKIKQSSCLNRTYEKYKLQLMLWHIFFNWNQHLCFYYLSPVELWCVEMIVTVWCLDVSLENKTHKRNKYFLFWPPWKRDPSSVALPDPYYILVLGSLLQQTSWAQWEFLIKLTNCRNQ